MALCFLEFYQALLNVSQPQRAPRRASGRMQEVRQLLQIRAPERVRRMQDKRQLEQSAKGASPRRQDECRMPERLVVEP